MVIGSLKFLNKSQKAKVVSFLDQEFLNLLVNMDNNPFAIWFI